MVRSLICAVVCLFLFTSAKADTFTLTSGFAQTGLDLFDIFATGPNIALSGGAGFGGQFTFATCNPSPCGPGSILNVGEFSIRSS